mmetsp:Transcript_2599/g.8679  ORF Transcript_2599/g.8679 Transcript_2599/m.8679 type:complete len:93 (-) Transcript_2599:1550-1828(-)
MVPRSRAEIAAEGARLVFGHAQFRPLQEVVVTTAMQNKDAFVLLPTGGSARLSPCRHGAPTAPVPHLPAAHLAWQAAASPCATSCLQSLCRA